MNGLVKYYLLHNHKITTVGFCSPLLPQVEGPCSDSGTSQLFLIWQEAIGNFLPNWAKTVHSEVCPFTWNGESAAQGSFLLVLFFDVLYIPGDKQNKP